MYNFIFLLKLLVVEFEECLMRRCFLLGLPLLCSEGACCCEPPRQGGASRYPLEVDHTALRSATGLTTGRPWLGLCSIASRVRFKQQDHSHPGSLVDYHRSGYAGLSQAGTPVSWRFVQRICRALCKFWFWGYTNIPSFQQVPAPPWRGTAINAFLHIEASFWIMELVGTGHMSPLFSQIISPLTGCIHGSKSPPHTPVLEFNGKISWCS